MSALDFLLYLLQLPCPSMDAAGYVLDHLFANGGFRCVKT